MQNIKIAVILQPETLRKIEGGLTSGVTQGTSYYLLDIHSKPESIYSAIANNSIDAIISEFHPYLTESLCSFNIPFVLINAEVVSEGMCSIVPDYYLAGELAGEHLYEKGYRNFAYLGTKNPYIEDELLLGFQDTLSPNSINTFKLSQSSASDLFSSQSKSADKVSNWLKTLSCPTGILVHGEYLARHFSELCKEYGFSIPEDIGILSSNNSILNCQLSDPSISSLHFDYNQIGATAVETVQEWINGRSKPDFSEMKIPPDPVIVRGSTHITSSTDIRITQAIAYIEENYADGIDVNSILNHIPIHRRTLEKKFKELIGRSPKEEILRRRVNQAIHLLRSTNHDIRTVSELSGFSNPEQMTQYLKKKTGKTSRQIRGKS